MMDNASNNDTLIEAIEARCCAAGIEFSARHSRMWCMPHTIHLAAMKVWLHYSIGWLSSRTVYTRILASGSYWRDWEVRWPQKTARYELSRQCHSTVGTWTWCWSRTWRGREQKYSRWCNPSSSKGELPKLYLNTILIFKYQLRKIIRGVRSSPQRRESWYSEVQRTKASYKDGSAALMLILDVKTRWSSTHQMLREWYLNVVQCK